MTMKSAEVRVGLVCWFDQRLVRVVRIWGRGRNHRCEFVSLDGGMMAVPGSRGERRVRDFAAAASKCQVGPG